MRVLPSLVLSLAMPLAVRLASASAGDCIAPVRILIVGNSGVGKSTLFNSLLGAELQATGAGEPVTKAPRAEELRFDGEAVARIRSFLEASGKTDLARVLTGGAEAAVTLIDTEGFGAAPTDGRERTVEEFRQWQEADEARIVADLESVAPVSLVLFAVPTMTRTPSGFSPVTRLQKETVHLMQLVQQTLEPRPAAYLVHQIQRRLQLRLQQTAQKADEAACLLALLSSNADVYAVADRLSDAIDAVLATAVQAPWESSSAGCVEDCEIPTLGELLEDLQFVLSQPRPNIWERVVFALTMANERVNYLPSRTRDPDAWMFEYVYGERGQRQAIYDTLVHVLGRPVDVENAPPVVPIGDLRTPTFRHSARLFTNPHLGGATDWRQYLLSACLSRISGDEESQYAFFVVHTDALRKHHERLQEKRETLRELDVQIEANTKISEQLAQRKCQLETENHSIEQATQLVNLEMQTHLAQHQNFLAGERVEAAIRDKENTEICAKLNTQLAELQLRRQQLEDQIRQAAIDAENQRVEVERLKARHSRRRSSRCSIM